MIEFTLEIEKQIDKELDEFCNKLVNLRKVVIKTGEPLISKGERHLTHYASPDGFFRIVVEPGFEGIHAVKEGA